ncbi:NADP-dependent 3-hydroxy acid dehydrogenase YdfG [Hymenobacter daecheongensis DSM 21074]|uniref:NADP-dependent 3-hydroxy acid dehydrogenase YdfG n=1 Tax=Hymenobacter daecheongensis DSM 21074 TaxID=1121955 RepID=A0A1M6EMY9_9BACT|nr:SDR family NAD(P)-dependent oxidoreductase [Hymenobacter daecheongensis]SHI86862.1 NADP-dependent 3-hydroxy acid dehydrogenase YdfG [Hymenobacter daecheongensis DSM 21074]
MNLSGKIVILTGVSKGIGHATARALLAKGAVVAGWGRTAPADLQHERFQFIECDIRNEVAVQEAYVNTRREVGEEIHVLINNAGVGIMGPVDGFAADDWHTIFDTNVHGTFYCCRAVLPQMKRQGQGHIINVASLAGTMGTENMAGYCATKFAVRGFSEALFKEVRQDGIKVTCVNPGSVETNFNGATPGAEPNPHKLRAEDVAATIIHALESPDGVLVSEVDVRPLRPKK